MQELFGRTHGDPIPWGVAISPCMVDMFVGVWKPPGGLRYIEVSRGGYPIHWDVAISTCVVDVPIGALDIAGRVSGLCRFVHGAVGADISQIPKCQRRWLDASTPITHVIIDGAEETIEAATFEGMMEQRIHPRKDEGTGLRGTRSIEEGFDAVEAEKEEKLKRKQEKQARQKREEEERLAAEEARQAAIRKVKWREEKKKEEEHKEELRKEMLNEISLHMGQLGESLQERYECERKEMIRAKGKARMALSSSSGDDDAESYSSDVEALSRQAEHLVINEKRKRGDNEAVGDSPPMITPTKRTAQRKLQLGCRHQSMKKTP
ncbi:hypothetical protein CBR_g34995 [Chara braunii]|uniref:Uncharacterized protein n=1 Tax=Chara braunii TaxID=69332 RepID=A0A388LK62_CHABU|nr:hypothetical protein CBR_g34995 [Chara braunii]|eukprot:GBG82625.1 hypothetical protein CBR_g34995 [Chara braunii]